MVRSKGNGFGEYRNGKCKLRTRASPVLSGWERERERERGKGAVTTCRSRLVDVVLGQCRIVWLHCLLFVDSRVQGLEWGIAAAGVEKLHDVGNRACLDSDRTSRWDRWQAPMSIGAIGFGGDSD